MNNLHPLPKKRFRVLFISFSYVIDVYQSKLKACFETGSVEVALLSPAFWKFPEWQRIFYLKKKYPEIKLYPANIYIFNGRGGAFLYPVFTLIKAFLDFKPEIVYVEQEIFSLATFEIALIAHVLKIPMAIFCWENVDKKLFILRKWTRNFVLRTACFITPGNQDAAYLLEKWGYNGPMEILPQIGVDTNLFLPKLRRKKEKFCIGYVGRLVYEKGIDLIFRAAESLYNQGYDFKIVICGDGPYRYKLEQLAKDLLIINNIDWLGEIKHDDIPIAMAQLDILILPSRTMPNWKEQFGHVLVEAMAMGIPVIGSSSGAIPTVIGRDDMIFTENNFSGLSEIIKRILIDPNLMDQLIEFGHENVEKKYTDKSIANSLVSVFKKIAANA